MGRVKYLLDTNVLSEPTKKNPNSNLMNKLELYQGQWGTCSVVWRELYYGLHKISSSVKKDEISSYLQQLESSDLQVIPFDRAAAKWLGTEQARLEKIGKTPAYVDSEIASIAVTQGLTLVTRNTKDFEVFDQLQVENWFR